MAEWPNAPVLKTGVPQGTGGSNPSPTATTLRDKRWPTTTASNRFVTESPSLLPCEEIASSQNPQHAVIWLHGLGADGHDFVPIVPELGLTGRAVRFVFPHAPSIPVTLNAGMVMPAWYDIRQLDLKRENDEAGIRRSAQQLRNLITREIERGIPCSRIFLAGFSQGGAIATHVGLRYPERLAGIIALSTYLVCEGSIETEKSPYLEGLPLFHAHGTMDPMVPVERGRAATTRLRQLGLDLEDHEYPMPHAVCAEEIADLGTWLRARVAP